MYKLFITVFSIALLTGCSKKKEAIYENDTDLHEWINQQSIKNVPNAHSGGTACVIDSAHSYSLGLSKTIENVGIGKLKEVRFSYWIFMKDDKAKANSVLSIDFNGKNVHWDGHPVKVTEYNKWVLIDETFTLPEKTDLNNQLSVYVWNISKEEILVDDLKIKLK